jgi:hypothetical protein
MVSNDPQKRKKGTNDKMKHATLTIPQKIETIRKLKSGESQRQVMAS